MAVLGLDAHRLEQILKCVAELFAVGVNEEAQVTDDVRSCVELSL